AEHQHQSAVILSRANSAHRIVCRDVHAHWIFGRIFEFGSQGIGHLYPHAAIEYLTVPEGLAGGLNNDVGLQLALVGSDDGRFTGNDGGGVGALEDHAAVSDKRRGQVQEEFTGVELRLTIKAHRSLDIEREISGHLEMRRKAKPPSGFDLGFEDFDVVCALAEDIGSASRKLTVD